MNIVRYNPMSEFENFFDRFDRPFWKEDGLQALTRSDWVPSVDISEADDEFLIKVEVPEVDRKDINIQVDKGMLSISGERRGEKEDKKLHRRERFYGSFTRSFTLPANVREDDIVAEQKNGMLYVHLKKSEDEQPKTLKIKVS